MGGPRRSLRSLFSPRHQSSEQLLDSAEYSPLPDLTTGRLSELGTALEVARATTTRLWLKLTGTEGCNELVTVDKNTLISEYGVRYRDLRILDPLIPTPNPPAVFIREKAIVLNLEAVRMIVTKDQVLVLSVPKEVEGRRTVLEKYETPHAQHPFIQELEHHLSGRMHLAKSGSGSSRHSVDHVLPFELRAVEAALAVLVRGYEGELLALDRDTGAVLRGVLRKVSPAGLNSLRVCKGRLAKFTNRLQLAKQTLSSLLEDDEDLARMYLGRQERLRAAAAERRAREAAEEDVITVGRETLDSQQGEEGPPRDESADVLAGVEIEPQENGGSGAAGEQGEREEGQEDAEPSEERPSLAQATGRALSGPPDVPAGRIPMGPFLGSLREAEEGPGGQGELDATARTSSAPPPQSGTQSARGAPRSRWHSQRLQAKLLSQVKLRTLMRAISRADRPGGDLDDTNDQCEDLVEVHWAQVDFLLSRANGLDEHIKNTDAQLNLELDLRRNELVALDLNLNALATVLTVCTCISGYMGMNLSNGWEESQRAFYTVITVSLLFTVLAYAAFVAYTRWKRLLFIPSAGVTD